VAEADEWEAVGKALRDAGVDSTDLGRFVNRPNPDLPGFEPSHFDARSAYPVLMEWLPRVHADAVKETLARRLAETGKSTETAQALLSEYREATSETVKWALGDSIARVAPPRDLEEAVELAADRGGGRGRQMLVYALWRVPSDHAREVILDLLDDPEVCGHAMYSLRLAFGNLEARRRIEALVDHSDEHVRTIARDTLKKIDRALAR
jgi:hypothetical protein